MCVCYECICGCGWVLCTRIQVPTEVRCAAPPVREGVTVDCELSAWCGFWELNSASWAKQYVDVVCALDSSLAALEGWGWVAAESTTQTPGLSSWCVLFLGKVRKSHSFRTEHTAPNCIAGSELCAFPISLLCCFWTGSYCLSSLAGLALVIQPWLPSDSWQFFCPSLLNARIIVMCHHAWIPTSFCLLPCP